MLIKGMVANPVDGSEFISYCEDGVFLVYALVHQYPMVRWRLEARPPTPPIMQQLLSVFKKPFS
jgi:hypothetical protein